MNVYLSKIEELPLLNTGEFQFSDSNYFEILFKGSNYGNTVGVFLIFSFILSIIILSLSFILAKQNPDPEKFSVYECGFDPFGDSRQKFEVRFFLVGILFIIFDLEISFLFPWSVILSSMHGGHVFGYYSMYIFLFILTLGLVYE